MNRPLLPALDAAGRLRQVAFALLVRERRPVACAELAAQVGIEPAAARDAVALLAGAGWLDVDESGRVAGAAGLSLATGPHRLTLGDAPFRTWCAYDALGIAAALEAEALVETACARCGQPIRLAFHAGLPDRSGPERLWLADGGADLRGSFCAPTVLLCGDAHGADWAAAQAGQGRLLDLADGARQGGAEWADCAETTRRLA